MEYTHLMSITHLVSISHTIMIGKECRDTSQLDQIPLLNQPCIIYTTCSYTIPAWHLDSLRFPECSDRPLSDSLEVCLALIQPIQH